MIKIKQIFNSKTDGITSILVVIAVTIVLTIIIGGISALTVRELRQASNTEKSNRALQTAESSIRLVTKTLRENPSIENDSNCDVGDRYGSLPFTADEKITCLKVSNVFDDPNKPMEVSMQQNDAIQLFAGNAYLGTDADVTILNPQKISVKYHHKEYNGSNAIYSGNLYPTAKDYKNAAGVELTFIYWPKEDARQTTSKTFYVMPGLQQGGGVAPAALQSSCTENADSDGYYCLLKNIGSDSNEIDVSNLLGGLDLGLNYYSVRVKPRYADTTFRIVASRYNTAEKTRLVSSDAIVDVTAQVGNLYRRVKARVYNLDDYIADVTDNVLYVGDGKVNEQERSLGDIISNTGICKNKLLDNVGNLIQSKQLEDRCK